MNLSKPTLIGFGIHDKTTFDVACQYADGAIVGSAYIRALNKDKEVGEATNRFISNILKI